MEKWKILSCNENYEISNLGNIRNKKKQIIKQQNKKGYMQVGLRDGEKKKWYIVHRLVAIEFLNKKSYKKMGYEKEVDTNKLVVNHIDENKINNKVKNLEWCTYSYNINYGKRNKKVSEKKSKKIIQYDLNGNFIKEWDNMLEIQRKLGIWHSRIGKCCRKITKNVDGYVWRYKHEVMIND